MSVPNYRNITAKQIHNYYQIYPEDFNKVFYNAKNKTQHNAAEKDIIIIPYKELIKLTKISDFFNAMYDEGVPEGETFLLHRSTLTLTPEAFKWIPAVFEVFDVHVENPYNLHYNPSNSIKLPFVQDYVRIIIHMMGLPYIVGIIPPQGISRMQRVRRSQPISRKQKKGNNNNNNNKSTRRQKIKNRALMNITGAHPLEAKFNTWKK